MNQLKAGDIFIFKVKEDEWISKAIAWLTDTDVSHAAMMLEDNCMVEMAANGITVSKVDIREGSDARWYRLYPDQPAAPLVKAAQTYIDCNTRYDFPALALLAGLIIYRKLRPTPRLVAVIDTVLRAACVAVDRLIQAIILKNPVKAMVCSQLVYQIYEDCGEKYHIKIEGGLLQKTHGPIHADDRIRIADRMSGAAADEILSDSVLEFEEEALAKELYEALIQQEKANITKAPAADLKTLPALAKHFLEMTDKLLKESKCELPIDALFITPGDIAYQSRNLNLSGNIRVMRKK